MTQPHRPDNPFPGLRSFTAEEDHLFFGREEQTMELLQTLGTHRFVSVVGTSGSGKSSLVRCGLLSQLLGGKMLQAGTVWEVAVTQPGAAPMSQLADALLEADLYDATEEDAKARLLATLSRSHFGLVEAIRQAQLPEGTNFLLVVDQFEEIFRFNRGGGARRDQANEFVSMLLQAARQTEVPIYIVLTMRSDFIGDCAQFENLAEAVNRGEYLIPRMTRPQFKQAIEGPVRVAGGTITARLLQRLLNDLGDQADQLPCLQHALMRTWDHWKRSSRDAGEDGKQRAEDGRQRTEDRGERIEGRSLDLEDYDAIGRMGQALSRHADEIYANLGSDRARELCAAMFKALTVRESENRGIRRPQPLGQLAQILGVSIDELRPIIDAYRQPGVTFLRPPSSVPLSEGTVIDISHESLMRVWGRLRDWVEEEAQSVGIFHRLAESAALHETGKAGLYRDPELGIALGWLEEARPNAAWAAQIGGGFERALAYLEQSRVAAEREEKEREAARQRELEQAKVLAENQRLRADEKARAARRMKVLMGIAVVVAVMAGVAALVAFDARKKAKQNEHRAEQLSDKVSKELYVADMNRARQVYQEGSIGVLEDLLDRHLPEEGERVMRRPEYDFWRHAARREIASMPLGNFLDLAVAPDQKTVAALIWPGDIAVYDVASYHLIKLVRVFAPGEPGSAVGGRITFSKRDGGTLVFWRNYPVVRRWETQTWQPIDPLAFPAGLPQTGEDGETSPIKSVAYSPDGSLLAAGNEQGQVVLWDRSTLQVKRFIDISGKIPGTTNVNRLIFSPDGQRLVAAMGQGAATPSGFAVLDVARPQQVVSKSTTAPPTTLDYSPDGRLLVSGHENGEVNLWDTSSFGSKQLFKSSGRIKRVRFSPHGRYLAVSTSEGNAILVWEMTPQRLVATLKGQSKVPLMEFAGDDFTLWSASGDGAMMVWDVRESGLYTEIPDSQSVGGLTYLAGGRLAWRDCNRNDTADPVVKHLSGPPSPLQLYDVTKAEKLPPWQGGELFIIHASSANGRFLAAQGPDGPMRLWNSENGKLLGTASDPVQSGNLPAFLAVANDGRLVVWAEDDPVVKIARGFHLWSPETGRRARLPGSDFVRPFAVAFSPDSTLVAIAGVSVHNRFEVITWDVDAEHPVATPLGIPDPVLALAFSPDGTRLAAGYWNSQIGLVNPRTGQPIGSPLVGHAAMVSCLAFCPDGKRLISGARDNILRVWGVDRDVQLTTLPPLDGSGLVSLVLEPRGRWLVSKEVGQPAHLWRLDAEQDPRRAKMLWCDEGYRAGRRGDFTQAWEVGQRAVQIAPDQDEGRLWFCLAALALHRGDLAKFREIRSEMVTRYSNKPFLIPAAYTAFVCTIRPPSTKQLEVSQQLARRVTADISDSWVGSFGQLTLLLGEYRSGNYKAAASQAEETAKKSAAFGPADAVLELILAMSQHHLGNPTGARNALARARKQMEQLGRTFPGTREHPSPAWWGFWMFDRALQAEAETLIEGTTTAAKPLASSQ
jgi:WD40 repeat protein